MDERLAVSAAAAALACLAAWRARWLRADGAWAAGAVGAAVFGFSGWAGALPLLVFFATSTLLGRLHGRGSARRHGARDARQVLANGGVAALSAAATAAGAAWGPVALAASLAAANADTWATEIGSRYGGRARSLGFGPAVTSGASGGVTALGTLAGIAGAATIGLVAGGLPAAAGGVAGMLADSLLGGTLQAVFRCPACGGLFESRRHGCPVDGRRVRGWAWLDNDAVNLTATVVGAAVGTVVSVWAAVR